MLIYRLPNGHADGRTQLCLTPLELIEPLAALIALSRRAVASTDEDLEPNSR